MYSLLVLKLGFPCAKICGGIAAQKRKNCFRLRGFFAPFCAKFAPQNLRRKNRKKLFAAELRRKICAFAPQIFLRSQKVCAVAIFLMDIEIIII